jgi:hypothetical protein
MFVTATTVITTAAFWVPNLFMLYMDLTGRPKFLTQYKVQTDKNVPVCTVEYNVMPGSNKVGKWKSCHQERETEHFGVTMAKPLWSHPQGIGRKEIVKKLN